jgi:hypothetical protein
MRLALLVAAGLVLAAPAQAQVPVVVVPGLELDDLEALQDRAAVGLLVPAAGPEVSGETARAALVRGEVENSLRDGIPEGEPVISFREGEVPAQGPAIVVGLPEGGEQPNDRRYPIAVLGRRGLLVSDSTRIPGLVSIVDVAPTALGEEGALRVQAEDEPAAKLRDLDERIDDNNGGRLWTSLAAALALLLVAWRWPRAAVTAFSTLLFLNAVLGVLPISEPWLAAVVLSVGTAALARALGEVSPWLHVATIGLYAVAMAADAGWIALSPLGPTQNSRFWGISNLLETLLLVPALVAVALLWHRPRAWVPGVVAVLATLTVASTRLGADAGGAIVYVVAFGVLVAALGGWRTRALARGAAMSVGLAMVAAIDVVFGPETHATRAAAGDGGGAAAALTDRIELSWLRATSSAVAGAAILVGLILLVLLVVRLPRLRIDAVGRAVLIAFAAAIGVSLVVNDSPLDVTVVGLVGWVCLARWAAAVTRIPGATIEGDPPKEKNPR